MFGVLGMIVVQALRRHGLNDMAKADVIYVHTLNSSTLLYDWKSVKNDVKAQANIKTWELQGITKNERVWHKLAVVLSWQEIAPLDEIYIYTWHVGTFLVHLTLVWFYWSSQTFEWQWTFGFQSTHETLSIQFLDWALRKIVTISSNNKRLSQKWHF